MTETGMSLGTPHYMSPEQAMGEREITARSDVYALGCVLYEMLTGDPPFTGSTAQAIVARVVTETPRPMLPQRGTIPAHVEAAVLTSLQKLPADRFKTAAEFAEALTDKSYASATTVLMPAMRGQGRLSRLAVPLAVLALVATIAAMWGWFRPEQPRMVARYGLGFPKGQAPTGAMELSPDGSRLVYEGPSDGGQGQLWVKNRTEYAAAPLAGTLGGSVKGVSPDGQWVAFTEGGRLKKIPITGGAAITLTDSTLGTPVAWLDDGTLIATMSDLTLARVPDAGGKATRVWNPGTDSGADSSITRAAVFPSPLPDSRGVIFSLCTNLCASAEVWGLDLKSGKARMLIPDAQQGWYLPIGFLVYLRKDGGMFAVHFDPKTMQMRGTPAPVLENIALFGGVIPSLTISRSGTLVMQLGTGAVTQLGSYRMVWVDRAGRTTSVDTAWTFHLSLSNGNVGWALSPDGRWLAIGLNTNSGDDIWKKELPAGPLSRVTFDSSSEERPRWAPDGKSITYIVDGSNALRQRPADGTGRETVLVTTTGQLLDGTWSRNGKWLLLRVGGNGGAAVRLRNILAYQPGVDSVPHELLASSQADESAPTLSPDGRWLAYVSDETGRDEVYIRPFPNVDDGKWQVSTNGAQAPLWAHSGRELFYVDADRSMMMAPVPATGPAQLGARVKLFKLDHDIFLNPQEYYTPFNISLDDRRFLMAQQVNPAENAESTFVLVENWFEEVKAKVGAK